MRIRTLVPAIACLAAIPAAVSAADTAPVKFNGFVDTIYGWSDTKSDDTGRVNTGFQYFAKLGADITISDKIGGKIDLTNSSNSYAATAPETNNGVYIRQAYGTWAITPETTFKSGRFIDALGWTSAYAPGLWRVGTGPITSLYGVDSPVGADVTYAKGNLTVEGSIVNGVFGEGSGQTAQTNQSNYAYGYIADVAYALANKKGTIDVEVAYDAAAAASVADSTTFGSVDGQKGSGYHLGANATLTPTEEISVGLEAIYQKIKASQEAPTGMADQKNIGLLATANYKIPKAAWNANVTGSLEYVKKTNAGLVDGSDTKQTEAAIALLTNPAGTDKFGVNAEIAFLKTNTDSSTASGDAKTWTFTLEALYVIP